MDPLVTHCNELRKMVEQLDWAHIPTEDINLLLEILEDLLTTLECNLQAEIEREEIEYMNKHGDEWEAERWKYPHFAGDYEERFDSRDEV
jgi:hypothetical protein